MKPPPSSFRLAGKKRQLLDELLRREGVERGGDTVPRLPPEAPLRLALAQERLWFLECLQPGTAAYHIAAGFELEGTLSLARLGRALAAVVARHEPLRQVLATNEQGLPVFRLLPPPRAVLPLIDLAPLSRAAAELARSGLGRHLASRPFRFDSEPLLRTALLRFSADRHQWLWCVHHLAFDGASQLVLFSELARAYEAPEALGELVVRYRDFAAWQRQRAESGAFAADLEARRAALAGLATEIELPTDRPRSSSRAFLGSTLPVRLGVELSARARRLAQHQGMPLFTVLMAAWSSLLARISGATDFAVGCPVANRTRPELGKIIGFVANTIAPRVQLRADQTFVDSIREVRSEVDAALAHQELPFERLVEALAPERDLARQPLFQTLFSFQGEEPLPNLVLPGVAVRAAPLPTGSSKLDLLLTLGTESGGELSGSLEIDSELFDETTGERLGRGFLALLAAGVNNPAARLADLSLLSSEEREQLIAAALGAPLPTGVLASLPELFTRQIASTPDAIALEVGMQHLSYRGLGTEVASLARRLAAAGVGPEVRVAVFASRSPALIVALLAVLAAGGAYVPIDPTYPEERQRFLLADSAAALLLAEPALASRLPAGPRLELPAGIPSPNAAMASQSAAADRLAPPLPASLAYLIYTSGSTGTPKGVAIEHASLSAFIVWCGGVFSGGELERVLASTSVCFDLSVFEIFVPLASGATVVLVDNALALLTEAPAVRLINTVPSAISELERAGRIPTSVATINLAGEPLAAELARRLYALPRVERVLNLYGPSEDTTYSTFSVVPRPARRVSIGRAIGGTRALVLDRRLEPVPIGVVGELGLAGAGLARGYLGRPAATAWRFVPDPFATSPPSGGGRLYKTGDLVRLAADGALEFLGRCDQQIKIRGFRVEPGEIENLICQHPAVASAAVVASSRQGQPEGLIAWVVGPEELDLPSLARHLATRLPSYMLPSRWARLPALPLTPSGKVDRRELARLEPPEESPAERHSPSTPVEQLVAAEWSDLLGVEAPGLEDNFFALGGHSLLAARLATRLERAFGITLPVRWLFERPTLGGLARVVGERRGSLPEGHGQPIPRVDRHRPQPLSWVQERLWFHEQLEPGTSAFNLSGRVALTGSLSPRRLARALDAMVARHEPLRTRFGAESGVPWQQVLPASGATLAVVDLAALGEEASGAALARREAARAFDLGSGRLLRAVLLRLGAPRSELFLSVHHLAADGSALTLLLSELALRLGGGEPRKADNSVAYLDFAVWQRGELSGARWRELSTYWRQTLAPPLPTLELPTDRPRPPLRGFAGASLRFPLASPALARSLEAAARGWGVTPFMLLSGAFAAFLARTTGQTEVLLGTAVANRPRAELETLVGCFFNLLVLRFPLAQGLKLPALAAQTRETALAAWQHQEMPFERLVEELGTARDLSRSPLFEALMLFESQDRPLPPIPGLRLEPLPPADAGAARYDLSLALSSSANGITAEWNWRLELFDPTTVKRWALQLGELVTHWLATPERAWAEVPLLTAAQQQQLIFELNDTLPPPSAATTVHGEIAASAATTPDRLALVFGEESLSYGELWRRALALAGRLAPRLTVAEPLVALLAERTPELVIAELAVNVAGAAYVPLDPTYPIERLASMLEDCRPAVLLTDAHLAGRLAAPGAVVVELDAEEPFQPLAHPAELPPDRLAYVLYTSGSTGRPKGVAISHRAVTNFFLAMDEVVGRESPGRWLATTSVSFDISGLELLWTLARGARVVLQPAQRQGSYFGPAVESAPRPAALPSLSLFYFSSDDQAQGDAYRLLFEGARFADRHRFEAVWVPERHFHAFGGLFPSPAVATAALAGITERVGLRAGSVVLPLHHPLRVAEEWAMVDRLSGGRVGVSFASGWHADDFVFAPERYADRKRVMEEGIDTVRRLWRGEGIYLRGGLGGDVEVHIRPRPAQAEIPVWVTAAGSPDTFALAGRLGAYLLTHLLFQDLEQVGAHVSAYREAWREAGHPGRGHVTLMLHTFVGQDLVKVRETVREPLKRYLRSSLDLLVNLARRQGETIDPKDLSAAEIDLYLERAFERYFERHGLLGTVDGCTEHLERLAAADIDELGCLIDFGVEVETTLAALPHLANLPRAAAARRRRLEADRPLSAQIELHAIDTLQATPSLLAALAADPAAQGALSGLSRLLVGGEALPAALANRLLSGFAGRLINLYGPTETTIWSTAEPVRAAATVSIGQPVAGNQVFVLSPAGEVLPHGVAGELAIAGEGLARGYLRRPGQTAERFRPAPSAAGRQSGARLYHTGDLARRRADGRLEFLGRNDQQVKIRGHRIELGEIEAALARQSGVREVVVLAREAGGGERRLVAYVVPEAPGGGYKARLEPSESALAELAPEATFRLPNGLRVHRLSDLQASLLYREIFLENHYFRHGIHLSEEAVVLDVGANVGFFSLLVHQRAPGARVYAFEPIPPTFATLEANMRLYGLGARLFEVGLAASPGQAEFTFYPQMAGLSGRYNDLAADQALARAIILGQGGSEAAELPPAELETFLAAQFERQSFHCQLTTLSRVLRDQGLERVDLLKIDVERAELDVLAGLDEEDWPKIAQLVLEVDTLAHRLEVERLLTARGYAVQVDDLLVLPAGDGRVAVEVYMVYARRPGLPVATEPPTGAALLQALAARLPEVMVPSEVILLDSLPKTANGKLDRRALPAPGHLAEPRAATFTPPRTELEQRVAAVWREVLGLERLSINDSFFEVGGNSLLVTQVRARLSQDLEREIPIVELFRHATVASLARFLADGDRGPSVLAEASARGARQSAALAATAATERQRQARERLRPTGGRR